MSVWHKLLTCGILVAPLSISAQLAPLDRTNPWRPATTGVARLADSLAALGDTAQALERLQQSLARNRTDANAWHRYGLLLWQGTGDTRRAGYSANLEGIRMLSRADTALRMATKLASDRAEFWGTLARFNLNSGAGAVRYAATQEWNRAARAAERAADTSMMALASAERGLAGWRRYLSIRNRAIMSEGRTIKLQTNMRWERRLARDYVESYLRRITPPTGATEYEPALALFARAEQLDPLSLRNARLLYMALAEGARWTELLAAADRRAKVSSFDGQARFARGLALVRLGRLAEAQAAFDTAQVTLDNVDRERLFSLARLVSPGADIAVRGGIDSAAWANLTPSAKRATNTFFWAARDPDATTPYNELELEFLARVVYAEFAWSDDELRLNGADTERAEIFVRYGPPEEILTIPGTASAMQDDLVRTAPGSGAELSLSSRDDFGSTMLWLYGNGTVYFFDLPPGYGTARLPNVDRGYVRDVQRASPVRWDNVDMPAEVDSTRLRVLRFRGSSDSLDLLVLAAVPSESLREADDNGPAMARVMVRLLDDRARSTPVAIDSLRLDASTSASGQFAWRARVPARSGIVQTETRVPDTRRVSRGMAVAEGGLPAGFTVSDVLIGTPRAAPASAGGAARWFTLPLTPTLADFDVGAAVAVGWELYDLTRDAPSAARKYRVALTVTRRERGGLTGLVLRAIDGVGATIGVMRSTPEAFTMSYERVIPAPASASTMTQAESLTLAGFGERTGTYRVTLDVTDLVTGAKTTRRTTFRVGR